MLINKEDLYKILDKNILGIIKNQNKINVVSKHVQDHHGIRDGLTNDFIMKIQNWKLCDDFHLYCIVESLVKNNGLNVSIEDIFTEIEIKEYKNKTIKKSSLLPLEFKMIKLSELQYIGTITARQLTQLKDEQLVYYNPETQRTLQIKTKNGIRYGTIKVNPVAKREIKRKLKSGDFVSNTITLNVPEEYEIVYDEDSATLIINDISMFDIIDGYHRFLALYECCLEDPDFDYIMEVRVVQFTPDKAKQFIYQEDQKTHMSKADSNTYNVSAPENRILELLKREPIFKEVISRTGLIDPGRLTNIIKYNYIKPRQEYKYADYVNIKKEIEKNFRNIMAERPELFDQQVITEKQLIAIVIAEKCGGFDAAYDIVEGISYSRLSGRLFNIIKDKIKESRC